MTKKTPRNLGRRGNKKKKIFYSTVLFYFYIIT